MTTVVVVRKGGTAVIAADDLTTFGDTKLGPGYSTESKLFRLGDSVIGMAGDAASFLAFRGALEALPPGKRDLHTRDGIFAALLRVHPKMKDDYFLVTKEEDDDPYESSQLTALIANPRGIFGVFSYREVHEYQRFWAIGSGREFALGAMYASYDQIDSAQAIAELGVRAGCEFDTHSGGPVSAHAVKLKTKG